MPEYLTEPFAEKTAHGITVYTITPPFHYASKTKFTVKYFYCFNYMNNCPTIL